MTSGLLFISIVNQYVHIYTNHIRKKEHIPPNKIKKNTCVELTYPHHHSAIIINEYFNENIC